MLASTYHATIRTLPINRKPVRQAILEIEFDGQTHHCAVHSTKVNLEK